MLFGKALELYKSYVFYSKANKNHQVKFVNFWPTFQSCRIGPYDFMKARCSIPENKTVTFFSCFGSKYIAPMFYGDVNIFYSTENLRFRFLEYSDSFLHNKKIDFSIGFDYFDDPRYFRFPYWIFYILGGGFTDKELIDAVKHMRYPATSYKERPLFSSLISSHDRWESRTAISNQISSISPINFAGAFRHNDDSLWNEFHNNKIDYLRQFRFNICPENTNAYGYVTEKIYEALYAGCVPVYWGSNNCPDEEVLNRDAIILFDPNSDNKDVINFIQDLESHPSHYDEFSRLPRLLPDAEDYYIDILYKFKKKLDDLLNN